MHDGAAAAVGFYAVEQHRVMLHGHLGHQGGPAFLEVGLVLAHGTHEAFKLLLPRARHDASAAFDGEDDGHGNHTLGIQVAVADRAVVMVAAQPAGQAHDGLHFLALLQLHRILFIAGPVLVRVGLANIDEQLAQTARKVDGVLVVFTDQGVFRQLRQFLDQAKAHLERVLGAVLDEEVERGLVAFMRDGLLQAQGHAAHRQEQRFLDAVGRAFIRELLGHHGRDARQLVGQVQRRILARVVRQQLDGAHQARKIFYNNCWQH